MVQTESFTCCVTMVISPLGGQGNRDGRAVGGGINVWVRHLNFKCNLLSHHFHFCLLGKSDTARKQWKTLGLRQAWKRNWLSHGIKLIALRGIEIESRIIWESPEFQGRMGVFDCTCFLGAKACKDGLHVNFHAFSGCGPVEQFLDSFCCSCVHNRCHSVRLFP